MATQVTERYCPVCGKPVTEATYNRFGEWCCSEVHAEEYVIEVRDRKQRQLVATPPAAEPRTERPRRGCC